MKIAFVWYFNQASAIYPNWRDGLRTAMEIISNKHQVDWYFDYNEPTDEYDFILLWDSAGSKFFEIFDQYHARKGICLTTMPSSDVGLDNLRKLDEIFVESTPVYDFIRSQGMRPTKAFGTDTDFYTPYNSTILRKNIEYFYPATFSPWKRQSDIAYLGKKLVCLGTVQPDGVDELKACRDAGVTVVEGYFPAEVVRDYYRRSKKVIIPAWHGSERTVLEAMSCNVWPIVLLPNNNAKAASYLEEYIEARKTDVDLKPREFVIKNYSHLKYAEELLKGIENG